MSPLQGPIDPNSLRKLPWLGCFFVLWIIALNSAPALGQEPPGAHYLVRFESTWSAETFPIDFPSNPHFSPLVGTAHNHNVSFWSEGEIATPGIEEMAERGQTSPLDLEIQTAIDRGDASQLLIGPNLRPSPGSRTMEFDLTADFPLITLVTMLAPSPDWFVGVSGLSLVEDGDWIDTLVVPLYVYDAGTDSGVTYTSTNANTRPQEPVHRAMSGPFIQGEAIGTFTFVREQTAPPMPMFLRDDRFRVDVHWRDFQGRRGVGLPVLLTPESGYFWFFQQTNVESLVKVLDGCGNNGHYWVFLAGLTNVEVEITVEDTLGGQVNLYRNELGNAFEPIQDTTAFATCP